MKKVFSLFLVIAFCSYPFAQASQQEILEDTRIEKSPRHWMYEIKRLGAGLVAFGTSYVASSFTENDTIPDAINVFSTYYVTSSLMTLGRYCLEWYGESVAYAHHTSKGKGRQKGKITSQQAEKAEHAAQANIQLTRVYLRQTQSLINAALKVGTLYTLSQHYDPDNTSWVLFWASTFTSGLVYNLNELRHTATTRQARNDIPVLGIIDGLCEAMVAHNLFSHWRGPGLEIIPGLFLPIYRPLTSPEWALYRLLQLHGDAQAFNGVFQIFSNVISGFHEYFTKEPQILEQLNPAPRRTRHPALDIAYAGVPQQSVAPQPHHAAIPLNHPLPAMPLPTPQNQQVLQLPIAPQQAAAPQPHHAAVPPIQHLDQRPARSKQRRAPQLHHEEVPLNQPQLQPSAKNLTRQEALERIQEYRQTSIIKKKTINQEIAQLLSFLTNAAHENLSHGKQAIVINFEEDKSFRIIFEPPHHQRNAASDEYKGHRKTRVLDALQVGYLHGWNEAEILAFMNAHNINGFYNIPLFLLHILWTRGEHL